MIFDYSIVKVRHIQRGTTFFISVEYARCKFLRKLNLMELLPSQLLWAQDEYHKIKSQISFKFDYQRDLFSQGSAFIGNAFLLEL